MESIFSKEKELFLPTYNRIPIEVSRGEGVHLIDKNGSRYLDFFSGLGVNALGYAHPGIAGAVSRQILKFGHLSNNFITDVQIEFAELLIKYSGMSKLFLSNSGTEAVEGAIKLIRKKFGPDKTIYSLTDSFHGRTYGAMTLTGRSKYKKGFEPLLPGVEHINFNDVIDLRAKAGSNTAAVFLEFIQGEGGINVVSDEFVKVLVELKNEHGFLIVADAIQCGIGRSGKPFSFMYYDVKPDILLFAKAAGGGLPIGGFLVTEELKDVFETGKHGTTFGGNPVSCAAGVVVLKEVFENGLMEQVLENGNYFISELKQMQQRFPGDIKEVRGRGYMIGIEMFYDGSGIVAELRERKVLINCTNNTVLRLLPPLIAEKKDIDFFLYNFDEVLKKNK